MLVRADAEHLATTLLAEALEGKLPHWVDDTGQPWPAVSSETPAGWANDWDRAQPFVTVAQTNTNVDAFCLGGNRPNPIETVTLQIECFGSGRSTIDAKTGMVDPATGLPFLSSKAEAQHLAQCVAAALESSVCKGDGKGFLTAVRIQAKIWLPEPKGDRSRYVLTVRLTVSSLNKPVAVTKKVSV